ncbi:hypothetical protein HYH03_000062 [Edaphochlamys debaryana]|uniref:Uncharacterized protein n=1 Tax=Edaphochlamys debaryana TaxID=47281 RepID=A0A835YEV9_9CHLO|nr:hypothetical protein HYH03_000062 [Edaphochlamys debaryana]|eukprot:KAG2501555.1 hypothetical protein HYH03_000062 [Edaphochlamys debaryana]
MLLALAVGGGQLVPGAAGWPWSSSKSSSPSSSPSTSSQASLSKSGARAPGGSVAFAAGKVEVSVNPACGNLTWLLSYDPVRTFPPPPPPAPKGTPELNVTRERVANDGELALREFLLKAQKQKLPYDPMKPYKLPAASYSDGDFLFATGSFPDRYLLAQATRSWRKGIRAFVAINNTVDVGRLNEENKAHGEVFGFFPDEGTGPLGPKYHGFMAGDSRAAMAPFLAHEAYGETYKWLLYGDDDTIFYMPAVKHLLAHLDPELPFAISDNLWYRSRHPNLFAPRCLPCHMAVDADPAPLPGQAAAPEPVPIPSAKEVVEGYALFLTGARSFKELHKRDSKARKRMGTEAFKDYNVSQTRYADMGYSVPGYRYAPRVACPFCTPEAACSPPPTNTSRVGCWPSGAHGGAGMIFSVGLLRRLSVETMQGCIVRHFGAPGGDALLTACLWEQGYAFTDPGATTLARYDGNAVLFSSEAGKWALHDPLMVLLKGKCDWKCRGLIKNAVAHHGRGRHFQNFLQSAAYLYANVASHDATHKWLEFMGQRDLDIAAVTALVNGTASSTGQGEGGKVEAEVKKAAARARARARARRLVEQEEGRTWWERWWGGGGSKRVEGPDRGLLGQAGEEVEGRNVQGELEEPGAEVEEWRPLRRRGAFESAKLM